MAPTTRTRPSDRPIVQLPCCRSTIHVASASSRILWVPKGEAHGFPGPGAFAGWSPIPCPSRSTCYP